MGRTYFEYNSIEPRELNRSPYRNASSNCIYCAYKNRPSASMSNACCGCHGKLESKKPKGSF